MNTTIFPVRYSADFYKLVIKQPPGLSRAGKSSPLTFASYRTDGLVAPVFNLLASTYNAHLIN
jgi:hypothetical protein